MIAPRITKKSICSGCGHERQSHCDSPQSHVPNDDGTGWHSCLLSHCVYGLGLDEHGSPIFCPCPAFEFNGKISPWRHPVEPQTLCTTCGHQRSRHCHKSKSATGIFEDSKTGRSSSAHACRHYPTPCNSTACSENVAEELCSCTKFQSPYAKRRAAKPRREATTMSLFSDEQLIAGREKYLREHPQPSKTRAQILAEKVQTLIEVARDYPDATAGELADAAGMSQSWVRRHLRAAGITLVKPVRCAEPAQEEARP
jgi:hypothetical protein